MLLLVLSKGEDMGGKRRIVAVGFDALSMHEGIDSISACWTNDRHVSILNNV